MMDKNTKFFINATGRFVVGGPKGDCGLTGRKIICDTYGGQGGHGGGAFSGKDPSKVDRSASYMARYAAKNIVAAGLATTVRGAGSVLHRSGKAGIDNDQHLRDRVKYPPDRIAEIVNELFDFRPAQIIKQLNLLRPIFKKTAAYGHFGREDKDFTWERTDMAEVLKEKAGVD